MKIFWLTTLLAGCAVPEREAPYMTEKAPVTDAGGFLCEASPVQYAVGQKTSATIAQQLMAKSGASTLRWIPPRTAVTMDFSPVRLNISYNDNMIIDRISCG